MKIGLTLICVLLVLSGKTQYESKYKEYKKRLVGDGTADYPGFIQVGEGIGMSIPASHMNPEYNCSTGWELADKGCTYKDDTLSFGMVKYGDASLHLGFYLGVLATEYWIRFSEGESTDSLLKELYFACKAYERLDSMAEVKYGLPGKIDGFFVRKDVPENFYLTEDGEVRFPLENEYDSALNGYQCIETRCDTFTIGNGSFVSQDQIVYLLYGLNFMSRLIHPDVHYKDVYFSSWAREIAHILISSIKKNGWYIKDPYGNSPPDAWGGNANNLSYSLADAAINVTQGEYQLTYQDSISEDWSLFLLPLSLQYIDSLGEVNSSMILTLMAMGNYLSTDSVATLSLKKDKQLFGLGRAIIHKDTLPESYISIVDSLLQQAPFTVPCFDLSICPSGTPGWAVSNRFLWTDNKDGNPYGISGIYNGLDFMLLHNCYKIYLAQQAGFTGNDQTKTSITQKVRTSEGVNIHFADNKPHQIQVYDLQGRLLVEEKAINSSAIKFKNKGLYLIHIDQATMKWIY